MSIEKELENNCKQYHEKTLEWLDVKNQYEDAYTKGEEEQLEYLRRRMESLEYTLENLAYEYNCLLSNDYANNYSYDLIWSDDDNSYI